MKTSKLLIKKRHYISYMYFLKTLILFFIVCFSINAQDFEDEWALTNAMDNKFTTNVVKVITLEQAIQLTLENDKTIKEAEYDLEIANVQKDRAFSELLMPSLSIGGSFNYTDSREINDGLNSSSDLWSAQADLSKVIFNGLRNWNADKRQAINFSMFKEIYDEVLKDAVINTKLDFYNALFSRETFIVFEKSQLALSNRMVFTYIQYRNGIVSEYEYLNAKVQFENTKPSLVQLSNQYNTIKVELMRSIGLEDEPINVVLNGDLYSATNIIIPSIVYDELLDIIMENNIDLRNLEDNIQMLEYNKKIAQAYFWPTVSAFAGANISLNDNINYSGAFPNTTSSMSREWEPGFNVGVTLSYSLDSLLPFSSSAKIAEESELIFEKTKISYDKLRDAIEVISRDLIATSRSQSLMLLSQAENATTAEYAYQQAQRQYLGGTISQVEVNDAEVTYLNAQISYIQSIFDYYSSTLQIMKLLGSKGDF